jgi:hypothetical protein
MLYRFNHERRHGHVLIWFALMAFALMGLAAMVIDMGIVRVTQLRMQSAADAAALEGLRGRDLYLTQPTYLADALYRSNWDPAHPDSARRAAASQLIQLITADHGTKGYNGMGPILQLTDGIPLGDSGFNAAQTISLIGDYQPSLEPNLGDDPRGDMIAGSYNGDGPGILHTEGADFSRTDFVPSSVSGSPPPNQANAFLVRLRRSNDSVASPVGSSGPPLVYLFGNGSLLASSAKAQGITVRATSIANAVPANSAGQPLVSVNTNPLPTPVPGSTGSIPDPNGTNPPVGTGFVIYFSAWQGWQQQIQQSKSPLQIEARVATSGILTDSNNNPIGYTVGPPTQQQQYLTLGVSMTANPPADPSAFVANMLGQFPGKFGYVPIVDDPTQVAANLLIGFGYAQIAPASSGGDRFLMTLLPETVIAPDNASAVVVAPVLPAAAYQQWVRQLTTVLKSPDYQSLTSLNPLLAPALVRSMGPAVPSP